MMNLLLGMATLALAVSSNYMAEADEPSSVAEEAEETSLVAEPATESVQAEESSAVEEAEPETGEKMTEEEILQTVKEWFEDMDWSKMLDNIQDTAWWKAFVATAVSFLSANVAVLLGMAIKLISNKVEKTKQFKAFRAEMTAMQEKNNQTTDEMVAQFKAEMAELKAELKAERQKNQAREEASKKLASGTSDKVAEELE